jgi:hypothetical protein
MAAIFAPIRTPTVQDAKKADQEQPSWSAFLSKIQSSVNSGNPAGSGAGFAQVLAMT